MMSIDALTAIENFASGIFSAGMEFLFTWGELLGIIGLIGHLMRARAEGRRSMGPGKFIAGIFICGMLVSLPSMRGHCRRFSAITVSGSGRDGQS